jgi:hypothetical protein
MYIVKEALICRVRILEAFVSLATIILENGVSDLLSNKNWCSSVSLVAGCDLHDRV